jgi:hypothetical protein
MGLDRPASMAQPVMVIPSALLEISVQLSALGGVAIRIQMYVSYVLNVKWTLMVLVMD